LVVGIRYLLLIIACRILTEFVIPNDGVNFPQTSTKYRIPNTDLSKTDYRVPSTDYQYLLLLFHPRITDSEHAFCNNRLKRSHPWGRKYYEETLAASGGIVFGHAYGAGRAKRF
jgi:hypothetical protein